MMKYGCDMCDRDIKENEVYVVRVCPKISDRGITEEEYKPKEICWWCKEKIIEVIKGE